MLYASADSLQEPVEKDYGSKLNEDRKLISRDKRSEKAVINRHAVLKIRKRLHTAAIN